MASKRKTILDILIQENTSNVKTDSEKSQLTDQQLNLVVEKTAKVIISAQKIIAKSVRKRALRLFKLQKNQEFYSDH